MRPTTTKSCFFRVHSHAEYNVHLDFNSKKKNLYGHMVVLIEEYHHYAIASKMKSTIVYNIICNSIMLYIILLYYIQKYSIFKILYHKIL